MPAIERIVIHHIEGRRSERLAARPAFQRAMKATMPKGPPEM
jgi:hypothetical protein